MKIEGQVDRLTKELKCLELYEDFMAYRISYKSNRTVLYLQIYSKMNFNQPSEMEEEEEIQEYSHHYMNNPKQKSHYDYQKYGPKIYSSKIEDLSSSENMEIWSSGTSKQSKRMLFQENQKEIQQEQQSDQHLVFVFIFHHEIYPFEAPFITIASKDVFPRIDDFRNYFYDIMKIDSWWPLITLKEIIKKLPTFANQLQKMCFSGQLNDLGQFQKDLLIYNEDIQSISPYFKIYQVEMKEKTSSLIKFYEKKNIYFTFGEIIILKKQQSDLFKVQQIYPSSNIVKITLQNTQKYQRIKILFKDKETISLKMQLTKQSLNKIQLFIHFYELNLVKIQKNVQTLTGKYNQMLILSERMQQRSMYSWIKQQIIKLY